ncbi:MAG: DUF3499 family protein [Actinomyces sp.]|nr:MAG: DUF3499 family protein [Actinomyces sp.]
MIRRCARPACGDPACVTLAYSYDRRVVWLSDLADDPHPADHDLCAAHAARFAVPRGWELRDRRSAMAGVAP